MRRAGYRPLPLPAVSSIEARQAPVAQLDRALPSEGKGRTFESSRARQFLPQNQNDRLRIGYPGRFRQSVGTVLAQLGEEVMATIRQKGPEQWHAQVRRTGWPPVTETLRTRKDAEAWARDVELQMDRGIFVDRSAAERTTFGEIIKTYIKEVTEKRPGEASRAAEKSRLERFMRDEPKLCCLRSRSSAAGTLRGLSRSSAQSICDAGQAGRTRSVQAGNGQARPLPQGRHARAPMQRRRRLQSLRKRCNPARSNVS